MRSFVYAYFVLITATFTAATPLVRRDEDAAAPPPLLCNFDPKAPYVCPPTYTCCTSGPNFVCRQVEICTF
ncbi:hypothetical protein Moror_8783 [Moniliophthora roreri MCA 2997]|uniref:Uncharacterized protein n=1 Tax=Moniliophthora roreri (strain MCA 2997) TaxID=1381753 RepID=V2W951_MONRO|nr:hypothetical protein Moror_8783 [Moniliophthora roreri MCA 2997]